LFPVTCQILTRDMIYILREFIQLKQTFKLTPYLCFVRIAVNVKFNLPVIHCSGRSRSEHRNYVPDAEHVNRLCLLHVAVY
jgi:hypothetical protein